MMKKFNIKRYCSTTPAIVAWVVGILIVIALYFIFAAQQTPYSTKGTVYAKVIALSPEVAGYVVKSNTSLKKQLVKKGEPLLQIERKPYALKVAIAENNLFLTRDKVQGLKLQVSNLHKTILAKEAALKKSQQDYDRYQKLWSEKAISQQTVQHAAEDLSVKKAGLAEAKINLKIAESALGTAANGINTQVLKATDQLHLARYYLDHTTLKAPADGYVENLYIHKGAYASPGDTKIPFILANTWWIEGLLSENAIKNIHDGQHALVVLDLYPGHIFDATVTSVGRGIETGQIDPTGKLPKYSATGSWFQPQQLFPFGVNIDANGLKNRPLRVGGTASIVVLKKGFSLWNGLAYFTMWWKSLWAYL